MLFTSIFFISQIIFENPPCLGLFGKGFIIFSPEEFLKSYTEVVITGNNVFNREDDIVLTLSQLTNFRLFQTEEFAGDNLRFNENGSKFSKKVENIVGKG